MFISKLKDLTRFNKKPKNIIDFSALTNQLNTGLFNMMESSFTSRKKDVDNTSYTQKDVDVIVEGYAKKNMIMAAASSIVPGPLGILGAIPELILNFGNQMYLIYDLGCAYDKENFINKDLLLDIPLAAFGGNTNLAAVQDLTDLKDSPATVLQEKAKGIGKMIVEKNLKKSIVQFIPVGGPIVMGMWSKMTTSKIANLSKSFLDQEATYTEHFRKEETPDITRELQLQKIKGLANLIESNNDINEEQITFIGPIIENAEISDDQKIHLLDESMKVGSNFQLDYQLLKDYEEDENLILEMAIMAKRSGTVDNFEKEYIRKVAGEMNLDPSFADNLLN